MTTQVKYRKEPFRTRLVRNIRQHPWLYVMILPAVAYFIIFHYLPMYGVVIAFQDYHPIRQEFLGWIQALQQFPERSVLLAPAAQYPVHQYRTPAGGLPAAHHLCPDAQ